jgi:hypothetical protein
LVIELIALDVAGGVPESANGGVERTPYPPGLRVRRSPIADRHKHA